MKKLLVGVFFTLAILLCTHIAQANTFVECEYGNSDACTAKYGASFITGHWTSDSHNADGSWTCISDLGQFYCNRPYWGQCAGAFIGNPPKSPGVCWAGLSGSKPPVPASQLLYGPVHPREGTSACSGQAPGDMPSSADLYCVCGVGDAAACPTPTTPPTQPPTPTTPPTQPPTSPTPQPTPTPILTTGNLTLQVQGIGLNDFLNPLHPNRRIVLYFYPPADTSFQQTPHVFKGTVTYNGVTGYFSNASFPLTGLLAGNYLVLARTPEGSLVSQIGTGDGTGPITIVKTGGSNFLVDTQDSQDQNADTTVPVLSMGNTGQSCSASNCSFNVIDLLDYNALVDCFGSKSTTWDCLIHGIFPGSGDSIVDSNDDGQVDGVDFTTMMKNFGHFGIGQNTMNRGGENIGPITPTPIPVTPTPIPTATPTPNPTVTPTGSPTHAPTATPTP